MATSRVLVFTLAMMLSSLGMGCASKPDAVARETVSAKGSSTAQPQQEATEEEQQVPVYGYEIVKVYPHDKNAFTQGLIFVDGHLLEGTGLNGESTLRRVELETGKVLKKIDLEAKYFGEGITQFKDKIYQLTWQHNVGFVYDAKTFERLKTFKYPTEGWGITHDGSKLIMSDGTANLYFIDPETLEQAGKVVVKEGSMPIANLNELEFVNGEVWANVWQTFTIVRIDPKSGKVTGWIDLTGILKQSDLPAGHEVDVMNGIAHDAKGDRIFITGKLWPKLYEIKLVKK